MIDKVQSLEKNKLLLFPFSLGLILMAYSWYLSYPLSVNSVDDSIFNHVSVLYWLSLPLLLTSTCVMAISFKNKYWKWIMTVGCVITLYSLSYFYYMLSSSDAHYFRGMTEYFIGTHNLDPSQTVHGYFQWPSFFILADITTSVSGLKLGNYEFLLFTIMGSLLSTGLYLYASKVYNRGVSLAIVAFFIVMFYFLNYQAVPFSLAFGLLFLLFSLETRKKSSSIILTMLILYTTITITHAFVPLFFVLYLLMRSIVDKSKQYFRFFALALIIYLVVQITMGQLSFAVNIVSVFVLHSEYSHIATSTLAPVSVQFDVIAQLFSRTVTIVFALLCFAGFVFLVIKRKLRETDKAIFLTGAVYSGLGIMLYTLGSRAIPLAFVPVSLGVVYLYESRFRPYLKYLVLIPLILFVFVPIHLSFTSYPITFQTKEDLTTTNFVIEKYNWNSYSIVISDSGTRWYIVPQVPGSTEIDTGFAPRFGLINITTYDCIIYSIGLAKSLQMNNISIGETSQRILDRFNVVYDSGFSYIAEKGK